MSDDLDDADLSIDAWNPKDGLPENLSAMPTADVHSIAAKLKLAIQDINNKLEKWELDDLPSTLLNNDWRSRAMSARNWYGKYLGVVRLEITRRQVEALENREERDARIAATKAARIAAAEISQREQNRAFVMAVRSRVSYEEYVELWQIARTMFPQSFEEKAGE